MHRQAKTPAADAAPDRETLVRQTAYSLYEQQGCIGGHELEHWIAAEAMVDEQLKSSARPRAPRTKAARNAAH